MPTPYVQADAIVVGAGAGGGFLAYGLVMAGYRVLLLERGPRFDPWRDYFGNQADWELRDPFDPHIPDTYVATPQDLAPEWGHLTTTLPTSSATTRRFSYKRACGLGGSTLHYHGEAHRFPPHALRMRSTFGLAVDWPLGYEDLAPWYEQAERLLGVSGSPSANFPRSGPYPNPAHPLSCASLRIAEGCRRLGMTLEPNSLAILSRPSQGRPACIRCKMCSSGCMMGDKSSVDVAVIPAAEGTGRLQVLTGQVVQRVLLGGDGLAQGVEAMDTQRGQSARYQAPLIVLAGGALETPRLLLNSTCPGFPDGLLNTYGQVGRYLMENSQVAQVLLFGERVNSYRGVAMDSRAWDCMTPRPGEYNGFALGSWGAPDGLISPATFAMRLAPGFGTAHRQFMADHYGAHAAVFGIGEQLPSAENQLTLDEEEKDDLGQPKARITITLDALDARTLNRMLRLCGEIARPAAPFV